MTGFREPTDVERASLIAGAPPKGIGHCTKCGKTVIMDREKGNG